MRTLSALAACPCGHTWTAIVEYADDDAVRLSGFECSQCSQMTGTITSTPTTWASIDEAVAALSPPTAKVLHFPSTKSKAPT